jgi:hypothetical protein
MYAGAVNFECTKSSTIDFEAPEADMTHRLAFFVAILLAVFLLVLGCPEYVDVFGDDDSASGDDDTAGDDDDDAADDDAADDDAADDDDSGSGALSLEIRYTFAGYFDPAATCADAWIDTLWLSYSDGATVDAQISRPCDDTPLLIEGLSAGTWTVLLASVEEIVPYTSPYTSSEAHEVEVDADPTVVNVVMTCHENGNDDGCGGA